MQFYQHIANRWKQLESIAPLVTFRILFGSLMFFTTCRFWWNGWIERLYVNPEFFFHYPGFEWVTHPGDLGIYALFAVMLVSSIGVTTGAFFRFSAFAFATSFAYVELIDSTHYLNHHYLVFLLAILLGVSPANRWFSLDVKMGRVAQQSQVPGYFRRVILAQLCLVYFFAGLAKVNPDWLFRAMPLAIWLPEHAHWPIVGTAFNWKATAFLFSWVGVLYDLTIPLWLTLKKTRPYAYLVVIVFHGMTGLLFNIGIFPILMTLSTVLFFSPESHRIAWNLIGVRLAKVSGGLGSNQTRPHPLLLAFLVFQLVFPLRHLALPGNVIATEEGYRWSWRVMLVEKSGLVSYQVKTSDNRDFVIDEFPELTSFQVKQMAIQPDMMLQYARHLEKLHAGNQPCEIMARANHVINGRTSFEVADPSMNLLQYKSTAFIQPWVYRNRLW